MYLKALELQGFKSFADKTVIQFEGNITAIVGPNGSGKSNISDAIRWVLGEQSTKSLRGSKMEDVIFGGTQKRAQVGYAEASLVFDNSDGALAFDSSEVMVTRRYYRSGESEYYINRQQVRLRDLLELFMDTGIGREGYSNIGQGKIDEILSLKSTDRREIFEEAAGISKYRHRKEETERKLESTEDNLLRIGDKISELELQIEPLRGQAEKAENYLKLKDELSGTEIAVWLDGLSKISAGKEKTEADYKSACFILEQEKQNESGIYARVDALSEEILSVDEKIELARTALSDKKEEIQKISSESLICDKELENRNENINRILSDVESQRSLGDSVLNRIAEAETNISQIEKDNSEIDIRYRELESEAASVNESGSSEKESLLSIQKAIIEIGAAIVKNESDASNVAAQLSEKEDRLSRTADDLRKSQDKLADLSSEQKELTDKRNTEKSAAEASQNSINGYRIRLSQTEGKINALQSEAQQQEVLYKTSVNKLSMLESMERDMDGFHKSVKSIMQQAKLGALRGIHGPVANLLRADSVHALAIETALGSSQQSIVVDSENDGKASVFYLKNHNLGRSTFLPLSVIRGKRLDEPTLNDCSGFVGIASDLVSYDKQYHDVILYLLGRTVIAEDIDYALPIAKRFGNRYKIVTLDGQVLNPGGSMTGGSASQVTGSLSRKNEIEQLQKQTESLKVRLEGLNAQVSQLKKKFEEDSYQIEVNQTELRQHEDELIRVENAVTNGKSLIETVSSLLKDQKAESDLLAENLKELRKEEKRLVLECSSLKEEKEKNEREYARLKLSVEQSTENSKTIADELSALREKFASNQSEIRNSRVSIDNYRKILSEMECEKIKKEEIIASCRTEIKDLEERKKQLCDSLSDRNAELKTAESNLQTLLTSRTLRDNERTVISRSARDVTQKISSMESECLRLNQKLNSYGLEEQTIAEKLWENYELTPGTASEKAAKIDSVSAAQRKINELKRKISALGAINLGAIDEFVRLNERYSYLSGQRDDVESAKSELTSILRNLTKEMTAIFTAEFERINRYFGETFVEMFGGGKASIELDDPDDPLGSGIEIKVQPPGKQLKTITLLSGGEKAFVAIALYFAIIKVRPTPFCMLDEIDAALDDRNVERFSRYLRSLSENTQFIVITHRRGTMEDADTLYGVTMQEQGISRILHLNLSELSSQLGIEAQ